MTEREDANSPHGSDAEAREHAAGEIAAQLRRRGVHLTGRETDDELVDLLDAIEAFESAVEGAGGDLMMDEPVAGSDTPLQPDDAAFALPSRGAHESVAAYVQRLDGAAARIRDGGSD